MSSEWRQCTISDIAEINPRRAIQRNTVSPFIDMAMVPTHARDIEAQIGARVYKGSGSKFCNGDTLLARITPCLENGKTTLVNCLPNNTAAHGSTEFIVLAPKHKDDAAFLYYLARSEAFREYAISRMEGTSGRQRVPVTAVANYFFDCPPKAERLKISQFLAHLDDRITLLRETNKTLESIAQAIFKSWFVDFDPVRAKMEGRQPEGMDEATAALFPDAFEESERGPIPQGWSVKKLGSFSELAYGKALKANTRKPGNIPVYGSGGITGWHDEALVKKPSIIIGRKGSVGTLYWESRPFFPIDTVFYIKSQQPLTYIYETLKHLPLKTMNTDAAVPGLNRDNVYRLLVIMAPDVVVAAYDSIATSLRHRMNSNAAQAQNLQRLRDTLLPRLISGKLRLPELQEATALAQP